MSELRNEPSASAANSGTVIMVEPGRMLMHHSRPRRSGRQGERTADNGRPMTDGGRGKRPAMDGGAWIAAKTVFRRLSPVACFVVVLAFAFPAFAVTCGSRRSELFQGELLDALRIVERGDMTAPEMRGAWAGEIGHTQFLPSSYLKYAV